jgi:outer membrane protein OmpA-like peptidoglycan-associated protein
MKKAAFLLLTLLCLVLPIGADAGETDKMGCADHPAFPKRMSGYFIANCETKDFDAFGFETKNPRQKTTVEGRWTKITYRMFTGSQQPSALAVVRNYENAIKAAGGTVLFSDPNRWMNGKLAKDGKEIWAQAEKGNGLIWLYIVEKGGMTQEVVADAAAFGNDLKSTGHVAVYGILFDTGKADIKPESAQAIGEIATLLKADAGLKLHVVGHTDSVGSVDSNLKLSQARAEAVLQALVKEHGIAAARLRAFGNGPFAPVASNEAEEGRAKNRRVELVKQ